MIEIEGVNPKMIANNVESFVPTHPGELLRDEIECRHLSQRYLANEIGVSSSVVNDIETGKRPVSPQFALLCEAALGIPAHILIGLQADYDLQIIKNDKTFLNRLKGIKRIAAAL